jgi:chromatin remodeling complex protein RSC6
MSFQKLFGFDTSNTDLSASVLSEVDKKIQPLRLQIEVLEKEMIRGSEKNYQLEKIVDILTRENLLLRDLLEKKNTNEKPTVDVERQIDTQRSNTYGSLSRVPSAFIKPTRISDELAVFLEKDKGTKMARTEVTREINRYIRLHNLQDPSNGRKINPDVKLRSLLRLSNNDELTYFNLQRYMSPHFICTTSDLRTDKLFTLSR